MKRLLDDPTLNAELRADLLRSRAAGHDYDVLAKLSQLRSVLDDPARRLGEVDVHPVTSARLSAVSSVSSWAWKAVVVAVIGSAAIYSLQPRGHDPATARAPQPTAAPALSLSAAPANPVFVPPPIPEPVVVTPESPTSRVVAAPRDRSSRREIEQFMRIRALLQKDPDAAYRLAQRAEQEYPQGVLSEERRALQVVALAKSGATQAAERKAQQFLARYPESPLRPLVQSALHK